MTEQRDILKIAKAEFLLPAINKEMERMAPKMKQWAEHYAKDPLHAFEWASEAIALAAEIEVLRYIRRYIEDKAKDGLKTEWTFKEIQATVWHNYRHKQAIGRSTSGASNLAEQHLLNVVLDFCHRGGNMGSWFHYAQWEDPENRAAAKAKSDAEEAVKRAAQEAAEKAKAEARKEVRWAIRVQSTPSDELLLRAYPDRAPSDNIINRLWHEAHRRKRAADRNVDHNVDRHYHRIGRD